MDQQTVDKIIEEIQKLGGVIAEGGRNLIDITARRIWAQALAAVIVEAAALVTVVVIAIWLFRCYKKMSWEGSYGESDKVAAQAITVVVAALVGLFVVLFLVSDVPKLLQPSAFAVQELLDQVVP